MNRIDTSEISEFKIYLNNNLSGFSLDDLEKLLNLMEITRFHKQSQVPNEFVKRNLCIIKNGTVRHYIDTERLEDQTLRFTFSGELLHYYGDEGEQLQAISDCSVYYISINSLTTILDSPIKIKESIDKSTLNKLSFEVYLLRISPEERYKLILRKEREIFLNAQAKYIASYLGITPQALSRIRKRLLSGH